MGYAAKSYCSLLSILVLLTTFCYSQDGYVSSRATYYGSPDYLETPTTACRYGSCGYGEFGRTANQANVAGVSRLYRNGSGCGACYQVRCKIPNRCNDDGVTVVATDYGEGDRTDFILSSCAYARLAVPNAVSEMFSDGAVDVEYQRVPCQYPGYNLKVKVHEHSKFPKYLALVVLYQAGVYDITAMNVWQANRQQWRRMRRAFGAVWDLFSAPSGPLTFRAQVSGSEGTKWVKMTNVVPREWKAGVVYDTAIQLS